MIAPGNPTARPKRSPVVFSPIVSQLFLQYIIVQLHGWLPFCFVADTAHVLYMMVLYRYKYVGMPVFFYNVMNK